MRTAIAGVEVRDAASQLVKIHVLSTPLGRVEQGRNWEAAVYGRMCSLHGEMAGLCTIVGTNEANPQSRCPVLGGARLRKPRN